MGTGPFCFCACSAGHVTIEVNELSDTQEKAEENKKSGGPGKFQVPPYLIIMGVIAVTIHFYFTLPVKKRIIFLVILASKEVLD